MPEDTYELALKDLAMRCDAAKIRLSDERMSDGMPYARVFIPNGRDVRPLFLSHAEDIRRLLKTDFEAYVFLGNLMAVANYASGVIECGLRHLVPTANRSPLSRLGNPNGWPADQENSAGPYEIPGPDGIRLILGRTSDLLLSLSGPRPAMHSIRIEGVSISEHDAALDLLRRLSSALFFQIEMSHSIALSLMTRRRPLRLPTGRAKKASAELEFPSFEYDDAPLSLYWYAQSAAGMPLLQFLAYYQAIEFYYPVYSQAEARRLLRTVMKDPTFRADRDADIAKILGAIKLTGAGFGDERSQLRATVHECVGADQLRAFLTEFESRSKFFSSKTEGLTDKRLPIANLQADLRPDVADRIYDIRCKIVHTKGGVGGGDVELLLPFSPQAEQLRDDIELMRFIARSVLIAASTPLRLYPAKRSIG